MSWDCDGDNIDFLHSGEPWPPPASYMITISDLLTGEVLEHRKATKEEVEAIWKAAAPGMVRE